MKKINLYDMSNRGYFDAKSVIESNHIFTWVIGGRGIGKTYSVLKYLIENNITFMLLRRTQNESDLQAVEMTSSLTKILSRCKDEYKFSKLGDKVGMIEWDAGRCYTCALSTFANIRGVNFDDVKYIVFDEFIKEPHIRKIHAEGLAFENLVESVNRNRDIDGGEPVHIIGLANAMDIANEIFIQYDLVEIAEEMMSNGIEQSILGDTLIVVAQNSPISKAKEETKLYKNSSEEFASLSIKNKFILNDFSYIKKQNLKNYKIVLNVGNLYLYQSKSNYEFYVSFSKAKTKKVYGTNLTDLERFRRAEWRYYVRYLDGYVKFESYKACSLFEKYYAK